MELVCASASVFLLLTTLLRFVVRTRVRVGLKRTEPAKLAILLIHAIWA